MGKFIDMTGWKMWEHGVPDSRLTIIERAGSTNDGQAQWLCECSCGEHNQVIISSKNLRTGMTKSCGCVRKEVAAESVLKVQSLATQAASLSNKKYNNFDLNLEDDYGLYGIGYCSNTGREFYFDMDDYDKIKDICWCEQIKRGFSILQGRDIKNNKITRMHSFLGYINYDHIDRNELNNRKYNLRPATKCENARNHSKSKRNTSGIIGVGWHEQQEQWRSYIYLNKKQIHLGLFSDKTDAIRARLMAEKEYFKEFAPQIHLFEEYGITGGEVNV